jgi:hypothetical protein
MALVLTQICHCQDVWKLKELVEHGSYPMVSGNRNNHLVLLIYEEILFCIRE